MARAAHPARLVHRSRKSALRRDLDVDRCRGEESDDVSDSIRQTWALPEPRMDGYALWTVGPASLPPILEPASSRAGGFTDRQVAHTGYSLGVPSFRS